MSVYELTEHPDFDFLPGDTVLKLGGGTRWLGVVEDVLEDGTLPELKGSIGEGSNHSNFSHQSSVRILAKIKNFR